MESKQEIEVKYLFNGDSSVYDGVEPKKICQSYLSMHPETRIRKVTTLSGDKFYLTTKSEGDVTRDEFETEISEVVYNELRTKIVGEEIVKTRYNVPICDGKLIADVDIFESVDLKTVEVEFGSRQDAERFKPLDWFGKDVTINPAYKNKFIAMYGLSIINGEQSA